MQPNAEPIEVSVSLSELRSVVDQGVPSRVNLAAPSIAIGNDFNTNVALGRVNDKIGPLSFNNLPLDTTATDILLGVEAFFGFLRLSGHS